MNFVLLPIFVVKYWYFEAPINFILFLFKLNKVFFHLFSLPLMLRTFFRPWKNEYRKGLIGFSVFMGMAIKSILILTDLFIFAFLLFFELIAFFVFLAWPLIAIYISFIKFL